MKLIFVRHAIAEKKKKSNNQMDDFRRILTREGIEQTRDLASTCSFLFKDIHTLFTSPLLRAVQTAEILYRKNPASRLELLPALDKYARLNEFQEFIKSLSADKNYCFVGHEPHLSASISLLLQGDFHARTILQKSGVILLEGPALSNLKISLLLSPKHLKKI